MIIQEKHAVTRGSKHIQTQRENMASPDKRNRDESQAVSRMRKELDKKQEALKISERSKNQLKK